MIVLVFTSSLPEKTSKIINNECIKIINLVINIVMILQYEWYIDGCFLLGGKEQ